MGKDEQVEEREVLDSIFPEEIEDISDNEYRISILLDINNEDGEDSEAPKMLLQVQYPIAYPEEPPILDLLAPPNAPQHPLFSVAADKQELLDGLAETIDENIGMAMIFALVSTIKENAEQLIAKRQASVREVHQQKILAAEAEENKKFHGTPVTPETFMKWRETFRKEMEDLRVKEEEAEEAAEKKKNRGKETVVQLTGRQLWERGLAGKVEEEEEEDDLPPSSEMGELNVDAS